MSFRDHYDLKFLESPLNLKSVLKGSLGKQLSTKKATDIAVCLQQGRLFFEAAEVAPLQIQPLQVYYGVVAFAKAVVLARRGTAIDTLAKSHGLTDISPTNARVGELTLKINGKGTFQEFNDVMAPFGGTWWYENSMQRWQAIPFGDSSGLQGCTISIVDLLGRVPGLAALFENTFERQAESLPLSLNFQIELVELWLDFPELFQSRADLISMIEGTRERFPFLRQWCFKEAVHAWNNSRITFINYDRNNYDDLSQDALISIDATSFIGRPLEGPVRSLEWWKILPPVTGGIVGSHPIAVKPINNVYLSEYALDFCLCFLLSSLVRYRPQTWQHAVSRSTFPEMPADDRALALIERFLNQVLNGFPSMVVSVLRGWEQ